jgi:hypothetical protein
MKRIYSGAHNITEHFRKIDWLLTQEIPYSIVAADDVKPYIPLTFWWEFITEEHATLFKLKFN